MTCVSEITEHWFGLCRKHPAIRMVPPAIPVQPETGHSSQPDDGGPGRIRKGLYISASSTKTLIQNPQLLWFALLAGLVLAGHLIIQGTLAFFSATYRSDLIGSPFVAFAVELPTVFCLLVLWAGLVLSFSYDEGNPVSFRCGLKKVRKYLVPLAGWSVVVAFAGTLLFTLGVTLASLNVPAWFHTFDIYGNLYIFLFNVFSQYPFNWSLNPDVFIAYLHNGVLPGSGSGFPNAFIETLIFSAINVFLVLLTLFVVPLIVLEKKRLKEAVLGSFTLTKNIRGELAGCVLGLGIAVFAASLTFLLFQFTGISTVEVSNGITSISSSRPGDAWIALGILYSIALSGFALIVATIGGIASVDLYRYAKIWEETK
jgi:hypothetical protein